MTYDDASWFHGGGSTMSIIKWNEEFVLGIEELDMQHRQLIHMLNDAFESTQNSHENNTRKLLDRMRRYALEHFAAEEYILESFDYPKLKEHQQEHTLFVDQLLEFEADKETSPEEVFAFLKEWLVNHLLGSDREFSACIHQTRSGKP
jgi:hemerythrin